MLMRLVLFPLLAAVSVLGQTIFTQVDPNNGDATEVFSVSTDDVGDIFTNTISTITDDPNAQQTSTTPTTTLTPPTASGTALPPFSSLPVVSGSIIAYSDFTATGEPTSSTASGMSGAAVSLGMPPLFVPAAIMGGIGLGIAML